MAVEMAVARRLFTLAEYRRMGEAGILKPSDHVELIKGEILTMAPMGRRHRAFVTNLNHRLVVALDRRAVVSIQMPLALSEDTEPEPDVALYRVRASVPYKDREASPEDAVLIIEVAESSLAYDRTTKRRLYATAGIPEYWIVDCSAEVIEVHRTPDAKDYRDVRRVQGSGSVSPQAFPDVTLTLAEIFA